VLQGSDNGIGTCVLILDLDYIGDEEYWLRVERFRKCIGGWEGMGERKK